MRAEGEQGVSNPEDKLREVPQERQVPQAPQRPTAKPWDAVEEAGVGEDAEDRGMAVGEPLRRCHRK